jgi:Spy/CpxP family protein refolding chaperone
MKRIVLTLFVAAFAAVAVQAQEIPERKTDGFKPVEKEKMHHKKELAGLNFTDDQKAKLKVINQDHQKQLAEIKKQDNITVKESREKIEALNKEHQQKFQSLLTSEQKAQIEKTKKDRQSHAKEYGEKRGQRMKEELKLTDEQSAKLTQNRKDMSEKM